MSETTKISTAYSQLEKIHPNNVESHNYGSILFDKELYFHGTQPNNISRLPLIMRQGILSSGVAKQKKLATTDWNPLYNGEWRVSVCVSPSIHDSFSNNIHHAFPKYVRGRLSFVIKNPGNIIPQRPFSSFNFDQIDFDGHSGYVDEIFIGNSVKPESIVGVMIPKSWLDKKAGDFGIDDDDRDITVLEYVTKHVGKLEIYDDDGNKVDY